MALLPFGTKLADELDAKAGLAVLRFVGSDEGCAPDVTPATLGADDAFAALIPSSVDAAVAGPVAVAEAVEGGVAADGAS